ncbi:flagellar motor protein MotB [Donghicola sp. C2-DW-16]|uniref:Flagellar motor protein MotB n=1 Tax=Donghicola mangrovi TaxID=2729614 RepID=A0ABX2P968_9RHOB|nr:flagellar motor protein MotB [Donghicola mangrovi]NVO25988.1 flagellar motor protein MotB [Donghicola mangrovi]
MAANANAPVIIKRKKVIAGGGHHGGAWKVAYADFVTAMMAFFLLMWLLNATTEQQRKGLADYFTPDIPVARISGGGKGNFGGESLQSEETLALEGRGATSLNPTEENKARGAILELELKLEEALEESSADPSHRIYEFRMTDEGPALELEEGPESMLFLAGTAEPTADFRHFLEAVSVTAKETDHDFMVAGHMSSNPLVLRDNPTWRLSLDRADKVRELLEKGGLHRDRIKRVTGFGDQRLKYPDAPMALGNNRIEIIILQKPARVPLGSH